MKLLSHRAMLGVLVVLDVALSKENALTAGKFSRQNKLPIRHIESMLQALVHEGILIGVRGPRGGYKLARNSWEINVGDIVSLVESLSTIDPERFKAHSDLFERVIEPSIEIALQTFIKSLNQITIGQLCNRAHSLGFRNRISGEEAIENTGPTTSVPGNVPAKSKGRRATRTNRSRQTV